MVNLVIILKQDYLESVKMNSIDHTGDRGNK